MDKFEMYYEYVGASEETDKERLVELFKAFLDHPYLHGGFFAIRWKENDDLMNRLSLDDFVANVKKGDRYVKQ